MKIGSLLKKLKSNHKLALFLFIILAAVAIKAIVPSVHTSQQINTVVNFSITDVQKAISSIDSNLTQLENTFNNVKLPHLQELIIPVSFHVDHKGDHEYCCVNLGGSGTCQSGKCYCSQDHSSVGMQGCANGFLNNQKNSWWDNPTAWLMFMAKLKGENNCLDAKWVSDSDGKILFGNITKTSWCCLKTVVWLNCTQYIP